MNEMLTRRRLSTWLLSPRSSKPTIHQRQLVCERIYQLAEIRTNCMDVLAGGLIVWRLDREKPTNITLTAAAGEETAVNCVPGPTSVPGNGLRNLGTLREDDYTSGELREGPANVFGFMLENKVRGREKRLHSKVTSLTDRRSSNMTLEEALASMGDEGVAEMTPGGKRLGRYREASRK